MAHALLKELKELDSDFEPEVVIEPEWTRLTPQEYYEKYMQRKKKFYEVSTESHEHNFFEEDHMSTLDCFSYEFLGETITKELELLNPKDKFTLVEVGAGTGFCVDYMCSGLVKKESNIAKYIYTDPFNSLQKPSKKFPGLVVQYAKADIIETIKKIQYDDTIQNAILLVCCPPPIYENRYGDKEHESYDIVSTDVMALVESVLCQKIKYVMIVRYNKLGRTHLDGTIDFYDFHVPILKKFNKWYIKNIQKVIKTYGNSFGDIFYRTLNVFSRIPI